MYKRLQGRVALVLGAGSVAAGWGNGKAAAFTYAKHGAQIAAIDYASERAQDCANSIASEIGDANCLALVGDVTNLESLNQVVTETIDAFGRIDILHYNVGSGEFGGVEDTSPEKWDAIFDLNLRGAYLACKAVLPVMLKQRRGVITMISSIASTGIGSYPYVAYQSSKAGLNHFTRSVAIAHAREGIRANAILPGLMDTPVIYAHPELVAQHGGREEMITKRRAASPTGEMGTAWDVANAALFLASDDACYINGVMLPVDGGLSCRIA